MAVTKTKVLAVVVVFLLIQGAGEDREKWTKKEFPNPTEYLQACNRKGSESMICDPEAILTTRYVNQIEKLLKHVQKNTYSGCNRGSNSGFQIAVAVLSRMHRNSNESVGETAEKFAKHLHNSLGVGNARCDDGAVLLLSTNDRQVYMSTGRVTSQSLTNGKIDLIIAEMKPHLQDKNYGKSLEVAVTKMGEALTGIVLESSEDYGLIKFFVTLAAGVALGIYLAHRRNQDRENCKLKLRRIQDERDRAGQSPESYESKSCPICLEEFAPEIPNKILPCGHKGCKRCLTTWLSESPTCPVCRHNYDELDFRLSMLHRLYPSLISSTILDIWRCRNYSGDLVSDLASLRIPIDSSDGLRNERGFGGGRNDGGGGRGGTW